MLLCLWLRTAAAGEFMLKDRQQIILLGDSLTEGEDPDGYVNTTRVLLARLYPTLTLFTANAGKGGNTVADLDDRLQRDVLPFKPDWVTICIGVNDINHGFSEHPAGDGPKGVQPAMFREKLLRVVQRIRQQGAQVALFNGTIIKEDLSSIENQKMEIYSGILREVAQQHHCVLVETRQAFREVLLPIQKPGMPASGVLTADGVHLNPRGSWLMASTLVKSWGAPAEQIDQVKPAVEAEIAKQNQALKQRLAVFRARNYELGPPCSGNQRVVIFGSSSVERWDFPKEFPEAGLINRGIGGETSRQMRLRFEQDVVKLKPHAAVIFLGSGNDFWPDQRMSLTDTKSYLARIARLAKGSGIRLGIGSLMPVSDHLPGKNFIQTHPLAQVEELNRWIQWLCAENGYVYIDFYHPVADADGKLRREFTDDGMHCNAAGYAAWKPALAEALEKLK